MFKALMKKSLFYKFQSRIQGVSTELCKTSLFEATENCLNGNRVANYDGIITYDITLMVFKHL